MQDGAPPHFSCFVTDVLNEKCPDAWIADPINKYSDTIWSNITILITF